MKKRQTWDGFLDEMIDAIADGETLYVRFSNDLDDDIERGYSRNWGTDERESGLSAGRIEIDARDLAEIDDRNVRDCVRMSVVDFMVTVSRSAYSTMSGYIVTGTETGQCDDGYTNLTDVELWDEMGAGIMQSLGIEMRSEPENMLDLVG